MRRVKSLGWECQGKGPFSCHRDRVKRNRRESAKNQIPTDKVSKFPKKPT
jgi:hypothetical protein